MNTAIKTSTSLNPEYLYKLVTIIKLTPTANATEYMNTVLCLWILDLQFLIVV